MTAKLANLRKLLKENSLDAFFFSSLPSITYLTGYSGFSKEDRDAFVVVTQTKQFIFTHGIYKEDVKVKVKDFTLIDITRENPISASLKTIIEKHAITKLGFEAFDLKVSEYDRLIKQIDKKILSSANLLGKLRLYKSADEISAIKKACQLGDKCYSQILKNLRIGMTERELAAQMEFFIKSQGAEVSFSTIVAFEENAAHPHHMPTIKKLKTNNFVLLDFGVLLEGYCSDMTRTVIFGKVTKAKQAIYQTVYDAQQKAIDFVAKKLAKHEAIRAADVDRIARDFIISKGYPSMPHSLGHGIGLEVHEAPRLTPVTDEILEEGMVFSIEPGIYLPDDAGVRIEDLFAIQNGKLMQLTQSPRTLIER